MNVVSLFAGCGGLDFGFEKAGFNVVWANELDETIHETYKLNHPNTILNTSDVRALTSYDIPDCDGIIGGPPCQSWSEGGKRLGLDDPRGQLFFDYIRIVKNKKPKFFVIENVQGILDERHKDALQNFIMLLSDAGYNVTFKLLNAANYKIPQDRFRVFFIGIRIDFPIKFDFPTTINIVPVTLRDAIGDIKEKPSFYNDEDFVDTNHCSIMNHDVYIGAFDAKYMSRNRVRGWEEVSFTIQAQARNAPIHPQAPKMISISYTTKMFAKGYEHLYRRLSVRECARIQSFPDSFKFLYKDVRDGYKMVGNAVPPRLAWYLAIQIKKVFSEYYNKIKGANVVCQYTNIAEMAKLYSSCIVNKLTIPLENNLTEIDKTQHVLICLVAQKNRELFFNRTAKKYYTGRNFPSSICLNDLYYFVPYIKGLGIRDLYRVNVVRFGTKQEFNSNCSDNSLRLIFEIVFVGQLFDDYHFVHLNDMHTFTDTTINELEKKIRN